MRRGEIEGRFDAKYFALREKRVSARYPLVPLASLVSEEPSYGSGARAIERTRPEQPRYIRITDFGDDGIEPGHEYVTADPIEPDCELAEGDLLFARSGATVGKTYLHEDTSEWSLFAGYCIRFRFDQSLVIPKFVYWFSKTETYARWVATIQRPAGQPNINKEEFKTVQVPLPDMTKQAELVAVLDAARAERRARLAEADALLVGLDGFLLSTLGLNRLPENYRRVFGIPLQSLVVTGRIDPRYHHPRFQAVDRSLAECPYPLRHLSDLCEAPVGGATPTKGDQEAYTDSGIRFLRILNIKSNEFDFSDLKFIRLSVHEQELKRSQLAAGDVLMTITGRVGTAAVVTPDILPANINQHIVRLRLTSSECLPEYLAAYLNSSFGTAVSNRGVTGGTRIALDYGVIQALPIPLPPIAIQQLIIAEVHHCREEIHRLHVEAEVGWQTARRWFEEQLMGDAQP